MRPRPTPQQAKWLAIGYAVMVSVAAMLVIALCVMLVLVNI